MPFPYPTIKHGRGSIAIELATDATIAQLIVGKRHCRVLISGNINSEPTGIDTAYSRFMKYTPETGFLYSSRIITDSVPETRFLAIYSVPLSGNLNSDPTGIEIICPTF